MSASDLDIAELADEWKMQPDPDDEQLADGLECTDSDEPAFDHVVFDGKADGIEHMERWMEVTDNLLLPLEDCL